MSEADGVIIADPLLPLVGIRDTLIFKPALLRSLEKGANLPGGSQVSSVKGHGEKHQQTHCSLPRNKEFPTFLPLVSMMETIEREPRWMTSLRNPTWVWWIMPTPTYQQQHTWPLTRPVLFPKSFHEQVSPLFTRNGHKLPHISSYQTSIGTSDEFKVLKGKEKSVVGQSSMWGSAGFSASRSVQAGLQKFISKSFCCCCSLKVLSRALWPQMPFRNILSLCYHPSLCFIGSAGKHPSRSAQSKDWRDTGPPLLLKAKL